MQAIAVTQEVTLGWVAAVFRRWNNITPCFQFGVVHIKVAAHQPRQVKADCQPLGMTAKVRVDIVGAYLLQALLDVLAGRLVGEVITLGKVSLASITDQSDRW